MFVLLKVVRKNLKHCPVTKCMSITIKRIRGIFSVKFVKLSLHMSHNWAGTWIATQTIKFIEGFKSQQSLNRHMDIHAGKHTPCTVKGCPKAFPTNAYLKEQMNMKHGWPYECQHDSMVVNLHVNHVKS